MVKLGVYGIRGEKMIRFAQESDLERVNEIRRQVNNVHVNGRPDIFRSEFCKELQDYIYEIWNDDNKDIIVIEREGVICGFSCVQYVYKTESPYSNARKYYNIVEFGVDESYRRQKVGTELFEFIKKDAKKKEFDRIELDMWEFNESALKFYESIGFLTYRRYMEYKNE